MKLFAMYMVVATLTFTFLVIMEHDEEPDPSNVAVLGAAACGLAWPLYWSAILVAALWPSQPNS
jgi:hypothetical protein